MALTTTAQIDLVNIVLMLLASVAAFLLPFELFLFSYAILGPLHYLTEIGWLHKRDYFATGKYDFIWLIFLCVVLVALMLIFTDVPAEASAICLFLAFTSALGMILFNNFLYKLLTIIIGLFIGLGLQKTPLFFLLFAVLLPTIIHVFVFTGLFIIQGALKNKSVTGLISVVVFVSCAISFFVVHPTFSFYQISDFAKQNLTATNFTFVNQTLMHFLGEVQPTVDKVFNSDLGTSIMRLIAFAYTYHYLNWFSKTSVIRWHDVPKKWLAGTVILWMASIALYVYDYIIGLKALLLLSMLHVVLEFPLNFRSVQGIYHSLSGLIRRN